jgi:hypothetical protein
LAYEKFANFFRNVFIQLLHRSKFFGLHDFPGRFFGQRFIGFWGNVTQVSVPSWLESAGSVGLAVGPCEAGGLETVFGSTVFGSTVFGWVSLAVVAELPRDNRLDIKVGNGLGVGGDVSSITHGPEVSPRIRFMYSLILDRA